MHRPDFPASSDQLYPPFTQYQAFRTSKLDVTVPSRVGGNRHDPTGANILDAAIDQLEGFRGLLETCTLT
ncbi:MAG: hypothetical protein C7B43_04110 [Sulfobacillus benefaciens]|uniref:Uncharacterized protein n=1 Tax=Sulfobacillus benefaciens TaxID=453960 RepID=A0A2T2X8R8_9FIRM|nr:MAG: hypothetical protein C7B43_04110 [Sulfobacillus benefaciens]HBQ95012.1 hypothetical protein [Sulfobacillus sp.]